MATKRKLRDILFAEYFTKERETMVASIKQRQAGGDDGLVDEDDD